MNVPGYAQQGYGYPQAGYGYPQTGYPQTGYPVQPGYGPHGPTSAPDPYGQPPYGQPPHPRTASSPAPVRTVSNHRTGQGRSRIRTPGLTENGAVASSRREERADDAVGRAGCAGPGRPGRRRPRRADRRTGRHRGTRRLQRSCRASRRWSTLTPTSATLARAPPRRSRPGRWPRPAAGTARCARCRTPCRSLTHRRSATYERRRGAEVGLVDVVPIGAVTRGELGDDLADIAGMGAVGVRMFSDDGKCVARSDVMRDALTEIAKLGGVLAQHAQDPLLTVGAQVDAGVAEALGMPGWPSMAETVIVARDAVMGAELGCRVHACHVSTAATVMIVRWAKSQGLPDHGRGDAAPPLARPAQEPTPATPPTRSTRRCAPPPTSRRSATRWPTGRST
jgi:hypothetical protein